MLKWYHEMNFSKKAIIGFILMVILFVPGTIVSHLVTPQYHTDIEPGYVLEIDYDPGTNFSTFNIEAQIENKTNTTVTSVCFVLEPVSKSGYVYTVDTDPIPTDIFPGTTSTVKAQASLAGEFSAVSLKQWRRLSAKASSFDSAPGVYGWYTAAAFIVVVGFFFLGLFQPHIQYQITYGIALLIFAIAIVITAFLAVNNIFAYGALIGYIGNFSGAMIIGHLLGNFVHVLRESIREGEWTDIVD